jgi:hypothetical protein
MLGGDRNKNFEAEVYETPEPDFSKRTLSELEQIGRYLDSANYPERALRLQAELDRRRSEPAYITQIHAEQQARNRFLGKRIIYKNRFYFRSLVFSLWALSVINLISIIAGDWTSTVPLVVQVVLLINIYLKRFEQIVLIRAWSGLIALMGSLRLLLVGCAGTLYAVGSPFVFSVDEVFLFLAYTVIGGYFFLWLDKSITTEETPPNSAQQSGGAAFQVTHSEGTGTS